MEIRLEGIAPDFPLGIFGSFFLDFEDPWIQMALKVIEKSIYNIIFILVDFFGKKSGVEMVCRLGSKFLGS